VSDNQSQDIRPVGLKVYGYCIVYRKEDQWLIDQCDEYRNLPAHYPFLIEAEERVRFLRQRGISCRMAALLAEETDTPEEFEENKIDEDESAG
jgi:hypothetical protein